MTEKIIQIAIDGPGSSGKSTIAKRVADHYRYIYVDTGAMYRALTYAALVEDVDPSSQKDLLHLLDDLAITFKQDADGQHVYINQKDVTHNIRTPSVTAEVSEVSAHPGVRSELVRRQQLLAESHSVVMDGRDIGTVVLPEADVKIFLNASASERARRRHEENLEKGIASDYESVYEALLERDDYDMTRKHSPLKQAHDAVLLDTTSLSISEVVNEISEIVDEKL